MKEYKQQNELTTSQSSNVATPASKNELINSSRFYQFTKTAPKLLTRVSSVMSTTDERIMSIYGATAIASSLMPKVFVNYNNKITFTQQYFVAVKPPGSGKGKLSLLSKLLEKANKELIQQNNIAIKKYSAELKAYEAKIKKVDNKETVSPPIKPKLKLLLISGNITSSMLIQQFDENDGEMSLMIFETEIDGLTNMMSNKTFGGDNSQVLRKAYHNELITQMRKGNLESLSANEPKLAIFMTGTPSQLIGLFKSNDDGLFSRFTFFNSTSEDIWSDVRPCDGCYPLDEVFDQIGESYYALYHHFKDRILEVKFSDEQWHLLNTIGVAWHKEADEIGGENATSLAKRHVNMIARCAVNYSAIRAFESKNEDEIIYCDDQDFINANWLMEMSFYKALEIFQQLPGEKVSSTMIDKIYQLLPESFKRNELAPLQVTLKISERTLERGLKKLKEKGLIFSPKQGYYEKVVVSDLSVGGSEQ
jgi:DNA-binding transcriptional ArsR family regulator